MRIARRRRAQSIIYLPSDHLKGLIVVIDDAQTSALYDVRAGSPQRESDHTSRTRIRGIRDVIGTLWRNFGRSGVEHFVNVFERKRCPLNEPDEAEVEKVDP